MSGTRLKRIRSAGSLLGLVLCLTASSLSTALGAKVAGNGKAAPVNPCNKMQEREEVFAFAQKPTVKKKGDTWVITFASKGKCDATVSIIGPKGHVIRHLASGVLGANAPHPFKQNSLSQKLEWDGEIDDRKKAPAGCRVRVSLGLKAEHERDLAWDPLPATYLEKDGKYFRTFWPPPADTPEAKLKELGVEFASTTWGDKVPFGKNSYSVLSVRNRKGKKPEIFSKSGPTLEKAKSAISALFGDKAPPRKVAFPPPELPRNKSHPWYERNPRLAVNPRTEELYVSTYIVLFRFDGKTGKFDESWFPKGRFNRLSEIDVGPDNLLYVRIGPFAYGQWMIRVDRDGKAVPFPGGETVPDTSLQRPKALAKKDLKGIFAGANGFSNTHQRGFDVSVDGRIVTHIQGINAEWAAKHGLKDKGPVDPKRGTILRGHAVVVWDAAGKLLSADAVKGIYEGHGVRMDRDGNLYMVQSRIMPSAGGMGSLVAKLDGITDIPAATGRWGGWGGLIKFHGQGGKYPLGGFYPSLSGHAPKGGEAAPPGARKLIFDRSTTAATGVLWVYPGVTDQQTHCTCNHSRFDLDGWARSWVPARQLCSVMVLDANGNRIARLGRYGNVDDEGLRFAWVRGVCASDTALYAIDYGNRRILKAALSYEAEEEAPLP